MDELTGFHSRGLLNKINLPSFYSIAFIDLDGLKVVNDAFGHHYGDILIKEFANHLKKFFNRDTIVRYGGDEFIVIREKEEIKNDCENFLHYLIDKKVQLKDKIINIRCSIGVYSTNNESIREAVNKADKALYVAKEKGRFIVSEYGEKIIKKEPVFTGRRNILSTVEKFLFSQKSNLLLIKGEKGIGKTRLLKEIRKNIERTNSDYIFIECGYGTEWIPFWVGKNANYRMEEKYIRDEKFFKSSIFEEFNLWLTENGKNIVIIDDGYYLDNFSIQWIRYNLTKSKLKFLISGDFDKFIKNVEMLKLNAFSYTEFLAFINKNMESFNKDDIGDLFILTGGIPSLLKTIWEYRYSSLNEINRIVIFNLVEERLNRLDKNDFGFVIKDIKEEKFSSLIEKYSFGYEGKIPQWLRNIVLKLWDRENILFVKEKEILWKNVEERFDDNSINETMKYLSTLFLIDKDNKNEIALKCAEMSLNTGGIKEAKEWIKIVQTKTEDELLRKIKMEARIKEFEGNIKDSLTILKKGLKLFLKNKKKIYDILIDILWFYEIQSDFDLIIQIVRKLREKIKMILPERYDELIRRYSIALFRREKIKEALQEAEFVIPFVKGKDKTKYGIAIINYLHILSTFVEVEKDKEEYIFSLIDDAENIFSQKGDQYHLARIYFLHGTFARKYKRFDEAMNYYTKAGEIFIKFEDNPNITKILMAKALLSEIKGNIKMAENFYKDVLLHIENGVLVKDIKFLSSVYTDIGIFNMLYIDKKTGLRYLRKALKYSILSKNKLYIGDGILNLVKAYVSMGEKNIAYKLILRGLQIKGFTKLQYLAMLGNGLLYFPHKENDLIASSSLEKEDIKKVKEEVKKKLKNK